jgi:hypothetical protein
MTAPVIVQPDAEALVWSVLKDLPGVTSFAYAATGFWPGWTWSHFIQADARAKRKQAARDTAETVRQRIMALPDTPWDQGTVCYVQPVEGPFYQPDPDGLPRYTARFEIRVHPRPDTGIIPPADRSAHPIRRTAASP